MSKRIQLRRGTATEHNTFTGAVGEVTVDTDKKTLVVHDGVTAGGTPLAKVSEIPSLVPQATETVAGKAKIATTAIAQVGTNNTDIITAKGLAATRSSKWENKTGMLFNTTYLNSSTYEKAVSIISEQIVATTGTIKVTFKNLNTSEETIVYFNSASNWTGSSYASATFIVPANNSFKAEVVATNTLATITTTVKFWSEKSYV